MSEELKVLSFEPEHYNDVIGLGNQVHGDGYLNVDSLKQMHLRGIKNNINASLVCYQGDSLVGFRLTWAPGNWPLDKWCTPQLWGHPVENVCYFKCNTIDERMRGQGIGGRLLKQSIALSKQQGATAGLAHIWLQSPGNSAFRYMSKAGGVVIKEHPDRWYESSIEDGYYCILCQGACRCSAAEMLIDFNHID